MSAPSAPSGPPATPDATKRDAAARSRLRWLARAALALVVLTLAIVYASRQDWSRVLAVARGGSVPLLFLVAAGNLPLTLSKARRSRLLLGAPPPLGTWKLIRIYFASYAADNLFMSVAGVGVRILLLRRAGIAWAAAAALQLVEKLYEGSGLVLVGLGLYLSPSLPPWLARPLRFAFAGAIIAILAAAIIVARGDRLRRRLGALGEALAHPGRLALAALWTMTAWSLEVAMALGTLAALHLSVSPTLAALAVLAVNVAALIPGLPGNFGTFEAAAVLALGTAGIPQADALTFALMFHLLHTLPVTLAGAWDLRLVLGDTRAPAPVEPDPSARKEAGSRRSPA